MKTINTAALCFMLLAVGIPCYSQQLAHPEDNIPQATSTGSSPVTYPLLNNMPYIGYYNYVRTIVPDVPYTVISDPGNSTQFPYLRQSTNYFDGLGRLIQTVDKKVHASGADIVKVNCYDNAGNLSYQYLPVAAPVSESNGNFNQTAYDLVTGFYNQGGQDEQPYCKNVFEPSSLNRLLQKLEPGKSWVGGNRAQAMAYRGNIESEVRRWNIGSNDNDLPISTGSYAPGTLFVTKVTDEDQHFALEYRDLSGRLIMKKSFEYDAHAPETSYLGYTCTYYVYDDRNQLRFVISPNAMYASISSTGPWTVTQATADGLCYRYYYDERGRMVEKKLPGKSIEYFVYDKRDRMVLRQDGIINGFKWAYTIYDALDRVVSTGTYYEDGMHTRSDMQSIMDNANTYASNELFFYLKNYALIHEYPSTINGCTPMTFTFYDGYSDNNLSNFSYDAGYFNNIALPVAGTVVPSLLSQQTNGLVTGSKMRILDPENPGGDNWLTTVNYYDDKGRLIQTQSQNIDGGLDISSNIYFFQGMLWKNILRHQNPSALPVPGTSDGAHTEYTIQDTYELNLKSNGGNDMVSHITQKINEGIDYDFARFSYDHMGRLVVKETPAMDVLQEYNMRGFLRHIDVSNTNNAADSQHLFEENLYYDSGFGSKLYNGNIAGITWRKAGSQAPVEAYGYSYDPANRLTHAEYRRREGSDWKKNTYDYTASDITYDDNGNLQTMSQMAVDPSINNGLPFSMDELSYAYTPNSNQLSNVADAVPPSVTTPLPDFKDGATGTGTEYTYDPNGNMTSDANKHISSIAYNYLNKPEQITVDGQGTIYYTYDAMGNRLRKKVVPQNGPQEIYDYIGNFVYKDSVLQYILNSEGRARPVPDSADASTKFVYDYFVKDHLGNVRSTVTAQPMSNMYLASMEIGMAGTEQLVFDNITPVRNVKPGSTDPGDHMAARLNGMDASTRIGTSVLLRTMPGDKFTISADAFYDGEYNPGESASPNDIVASLTDALLGGTTYAGIPLKELPDNSRIIATTLSNPNLPGQLADLLHNVNDEELPKAHLNILFFDDKMELKPDRCRIIPVPRMPTGNTNWVVLDPSITGGMTGYDPGTVSDGPGYILVYVDNQSIGKDVWFDNVRIQHYRGEVLEENHYYPFGLTLQTSQAAGVSEQPHKYNTKELEKHFGLELYDYGARMLDPQLGMWHVPDPMAEKFLYESPYTYAGNNPVINIDWEGKIKMTAGDQEKYTKTYPLIMQYLTSNQLRADATGNPDILNAYQQFRPNYTADQIKKYVYYITTWGNGPLLDFTTTPGFPQNSAEGHYNSEEDLIEFRTMRADNLELFLGSNAPELSKRIELLKFYMVLLHEMAHKTDVPDHVQTETGEHEDQTRGSHKNVELGEEGYKFDQDVWGTDKYKPYDNSNDPTSDHNLTPYTPGVIEEVLKKLGTEHDGMKKLPNLPVPTPNDHKFKQN